MRTNLRFITCLLWLFTFTSVAADTKPQHQPVVSQQQSETIYAQIFAMQDRLGQLEAGLQQQQGHTEDLKDAEKELQQLKVQLTRLEQQLSSQKEVQSNEVSVVSARVSDAQASMNWWFTGLGIFLAILTLMLAFGGFLTYRQSKAESKTAAEQQINEFIEKEIPKLLDSANAEILKKAENDIEDVRAQLTASFIQKWEDFLSPLQNQAEQILNSEVISGKQHPEYEFSDEQKQKLSFATTLKPEAEFTAKDWYHRSSAQIANGNFSAALQSIEHALSEKAELSSLELVKFLFRKALCFSYLNDSKQAISLYDDLINEFANNSNPKIQEVVAQAMFNKGFRFGKLNDPMSEMAAYDRVIEKFGSNHDHAIQKVVADSMSNKGTCLARLNKPKESIDVYDILISKFVDSTEPALQENVAAAMANQTEAALQVETPSEVLKRITVCESKTKDPQITVVMLFLRFILDDVSIGTVLEALKVMPEGTELNWGFKEIKPYLYKSLSGNKLRQCEAVIAFFENHKNITQLAAELSEIG